MKYELNVPYDFELKNVINKNGNLKFEVEVGGHLFPVKAYPEQLEPSAPHIISCRIVQDKNKNAYLTQNEAFLYPYIYKPLCRYIFEVIDIRDNIVILQDKHGLYHTMTKDDSSFSINEIIIRCVEIVNDINGKAHLTFYYTEPVEMEASIEKRQVSEPTDVAQPQYAPTIFEEDQPEDIEVASSKITNSNATNITGPNYKPNVSVTELLASEDWDSLRASLSTNLVGVKIRPILQEIANALENCSSYDKYWNAIRFFVEYDAHMFLMTLASVDTTRITGNIDDINENNLNDIIHLAFKAKDKLKHAIDLIKPCKNLLNIEQKNFIQMQCADLNSNEAFYDLFKLLGLSPDDAIVYLLSLKENPCAAYTIYKFYFDGKKGGHLKETSRIESFRPSKISQYIKIMRFNIELSAFKAAASLIESTILSSKNYLPVLQKEVSNNGYDGFRKYIMAREQQIKSKKLLSSISVGDSLYDLIFIKELDNHYLLAEPQTGSYVLLVKKLTTERPSKDKKSQAIIAQVLHHKNKSIFVASQTKVSSTYPFPPIINKYTKLELSFTRGNNGIWYIDTNNYCKLLSINIISRPRFIDYKSKCQAEIVNSEDFFSYNVKIL